MTSIQKKTVLTASSLAVLLALGACGRNDDATVGQKMDSAVTKTEQARAEVKSDVSDATASASSATKEMGASAGERIDDATITSKVNAELATDKDLSAIRIDVDTRDGVVTLSGPAPSATARERASELARSVKGVNSVNNQLTIKAG
jgi:hyperosmotically inducible protein